MTILWPPDVKNWLIGKDPDAGKDWRQEQKGMTEDKMVGWHHQLNGHESEQAPGIGDRQRSLACCSPWGLKESYTMEQLNWHLFSFPGGAVLKNLPAKAEDKVSIPGSGWSPGAGNGNPFQYSCLKNSMHRGAWQAIVHGVTKSQTWLNDWARTHKRRGLQRHTRGGNQGWLLNFWSFRLTGWVPGAFKKQRILGVKPILEEKSIVLFSM